MVMGAVMGGAMLASALSSKKGSGGSEALRRAIDEFSRLRAPTPEEMKVKLEELILQGVITPEQAQTYLMENSEWEGVEADPLAKSAQMKALAQLQEVSTEGITPIEKASIRRIQDELETSSRGDSLAIMEGMARKGKGGSGMELAARLSANQAATGRASREGLDTAARARERSLAAIMKSGQLGGQIRGQGYNEDARKAEALDAIKRFNVSNRQSVEGQNVDRRNMAQYQNLGEKQRVGDYNVDLRNRNRLRDSDLKQKEFENKMAIAAGKSGQYSSMGSLEEERRKADLAYKGSLISSGGQLLSSWE